MFKLVSLLITIMSLLGCTGENDVETTGLNRLKVQSTSDKFIPPDGKILLFIGQDSDTISDYMMDVPEDNIEGVTLYSQLKSNTLESSLKGVFSEGNWHSGTVDFNKTLSETKNAALAVGLAFDTCGQIDHQKNIANGAYDKSLKKLIHYFKSLAPRKVFLRIGYEFDGPWNCYTPELYTLAFQHIYKSIKSIEANNVVTVWQTATWPDSYGHQIYDSSLPDHFNRWYPGDEYVDWISMSVFYRDLSQWNYVPPSGPEITQNRLLEFARDHKKPVMISESAPQGYRIAELTQSVIQENAPESTTAEQIWLSWYQPYFDFIYANKDVIRAVAYINTHWDSQLMWQCDRGVPAGSENCIQGNWGDSRVQANPYIKARWLKQVNDTNHWIQSGGY